MLLQNGAKVCKQWLTLFSRCPKAYHQQFLTLMDTLSLPYQTCKLWQTFEILFPAGCLHWTGQGWNTSTPSFSLQPAFVTRFARLCPTCVAGAAGNKLDGMTKLLEMYIVYSRLDFKSPIRCRCSIPAIILRAPHKEPKDYFERFHRSYRRLNHTNFVLKMKPAIKPVDNSKKSVTSLQTPLSEDLVKVLENYRIARLSLPGKWRRNVQIKKKDLGRRSTLSNVSRGSLLLWDDGHHQKTLTWHLGGGMPICQEYGERQNTENWKEYSGYL